MATPPSIYRVLLLVGFLPGTLWALTACDAPAAPIGSAAEAGGPPLVFGATISITGPTAKEGEYTRDGYQFALAEINRGGGAVGGYLGLPTRRLRRLD